MALTIRDLAEKLNLSITTVSRALDGYSDVAEETRKRVVETAHEMGYKPSYAARQLRRKRTDSVGYILPTSSPSFSDPFYINFLSGLCDEVATQNLDLMVTSCPPNSEQENDQYRRWVQSRRVDGFVLNRTRIDDWRIDYLTQNKIPFVALGTGESDASFPFICINDTQGLEDLVTHLVENGHRRIAFIGASPNLVIQVDRFKGYQQGLEKANIPFDPDLIEPGDLTEEGGYRAARKLLKGPRPPTAILGINDLTALGILLAAKERGLSIGTELAVAGYDGIKETEYTNPPLTTLFQPTYEIAREMAKMLVKVIEGERLEQSSITIKPNLIIRASTGK
ncbi:MAG: LacI family DNA-binding transcriptional regulator [Anaerolineaceae bacterium]|nr:LacI family DNA-binding transcriptional regulator [Anaerolineaceae bacterium]